MPLPKQIHNGDMPDADDVMANFNWLSAGKGVKKDTYDNLLACAAAAPAEPFLCYATDNRQAMLYTGDSSIGTNGFIALGGAL